MQVFGLVLKENAMRKPRLKKSLGMWYCYGKGPMGILACTSGEDFLAFANWQIRQIDLQNEKIVIAMLSNKKDRSL